MKKLYPLSLSIQHGAWQRYYARSHNPRFTSTAKRILRRDGHHCRFCGFWCDKYHTVINKDNNYSNNRASNMVTACQFCAQCFFLDGMEMDEKLGGLVIYLPEISQVDLNNLCRAFFHVLAKDSPYRTQVQATYLSLKDRSEMVERTFGPRTSEPMIFAQSFLDCGVPSSHMHREYLEPLRVLPIRNRFKEQIQYWARQVFYKYPL